MGETEQHAFLSNCAKRRTNNPLTSGSHPTVLEGCLMIQEQVYMWLVKISSSCLLYNVGSLTSNIYNLFHETTLRSSVFA